MKKLWFSVLFVVLMLTGCGTAEITLESDGSGEVKYKVMENEYYTFEDIKHQVENEVESANKSAGKKVVKLKKVTEKDGIMEINIKFKDIEMSRQEMFGQVKVSDMLRYEPSKVSQLVDSKGKAINLEDKKIKNYTYLVFHDTSYFETKLTVPGEVKYVSDGVKFTKGEKNTIETDTSSFVIVYDKKGSFGLIKGFFMLIGVIVVIAAGFFLFKSGILSKVKIPAPNKKNATEGAAKDE